MILKMYDQSLWNKKCVEPIKRNKDGVHWIVHRFPIKNGISIRDAMIYDMLQPNPFIDLMRKLYLINSRDIR